MSIQITCQSNALQMVARCVCSVVGGNSCNLPIELCFDEKGSKFSKWLRCFWRQTEYWKKTQARANKLVSVFVNCCQSFALILISNFFIFAVLCISGAFVFWFCWKIYMHWIPFIDILMELMWICISTILNGCKNFIFLDPFFHLKENHFFRSQFAKAKFDWQWNGNIVGNENAKYEKEKKSNNNPTWNWFTTIWNTT